MAEKRVGGIYAELGVNVAAFERGMARAKQITKQTADSVTRDVGRMSAAAGGGAVGAGAVGGGPGGGGPVGLFGGQLGRAGRIVRGAGGLTAAYGASLFAFSAGESLSRFVIDRTTSRRQAHYEATAGLLGEDRMAVNRAEQMVLEQAQNRSLGRSFFGRIASTIGYASRFEWAAAARESGVLGRGITPEDDALDLVRFQMNQDRMTANAQRRRATQNRYANDRNSALESMTRVGSHGMSDLSLMQMDQGSRVLNIMGRQLRAMSEVASRPGGMPSGTGGK